MNSDKFTLGHQVIRSEKDDEYNSKYLIIDDQSDASKIVLDQMLNLSKLDTSSQIYYFGGLNKEDELSLLSTLSNYLSNGYRLILLGFTDVNFKQNIFKDWDFINISSKYSEESTNIGYQRHLNINQDDSRKIWDIGLGILKNDILQSELSIRDAQFLSLSLDVLKRAEIPGNLNASVHGIFSEQLCQLSKLCGTSSNLSIAQFGGMSSLCTAEEAEILADSIWYFLEGTELQTNEDPSSMENMQEFVIQSSDMSHDYTFVKSLVSNKIWFKCSSENMLGRFIPCSDEDFDNVSNDHIPARILSHT